MDDEDNEVGHHDASEEDADEGEGLEELADGKPVVLIVLVEVLVVHVLDEGGIVEDDHVSDKRGLEGIVEIGDESEVVDGHETDQLQVLDEDPGGEESNTTDGQGDELGQDEDNEDPVHGLGGISESLHNIVLKVKDHLEADLLLLNSKLVGGGVSEPKASVISLVIDINMESVTLLDKKTNSVGLRELHGEVNGHTVLVEVSDGEVLKL